MKLSMKTQLKTLLTAAVLASVMHTASGNDNSMMIPELWAQESLAILEETMIVGMMVNRDFENTFAQYGEIIHTRKPQLFRGKRKTDDDDVTIQAAKSTPITVPLNQWIHISFTIKDGERSKSFKDLVKYYLEPAMIAEASFLDKVVSGQVIQFLANNGGRMGFGSKTTVSDYILEAGEVMNRNKAPAQGRNLVVTTGTNTLLNQTELFVSAQSRGDGGNALESAQIGRLHGFNINFAQNMPEVSAANLDVDATYLVNNVAGYVKGDTVLATDVGTTLVQVGQWLTVAGDDVPQVVTAVTNTGTTSHMTQVTISPGLSHAVADDAVITCVLPVYVNLSGGYAVGWAKEIVYDLSPGSQTPQIGQPVTFVGDATNRYMIVDVDTVASTITLDRPLVAAIANNAEIFLGPAGKYNFAFLSGALAVVCRPLAPPESGTGALSAVVNHNGYAVRVTITYNGLSQGHLVTIDCLAGVAVLESALGALMCA